MFPDRHASRLLFCLALCVTLPAAEDDPAPPATPSPATAAPGESADLASLRAKAVRGNSIAQYNLGLAYAQSASPSSPDDRIEAFVWLTLATEGGSTGRALETVLALLSNEELAAGRRRLEAMRATNPLLRPPVPSATKAHADTAAAPGVTIKPSAPAAPPAPIAPPGGPAAEGGTQLPPTKVGGLEGATESRGCG